MARTKQTARKSTKTAKPRKTAESAKADSPKAAPAAAKKKKAADPPKVPGNAVLRRLAMAAAPDMEHGVNKEAYSHILQIYMRNLESLAGHARKEFEAINKSLEAKDKPITKNVNFKALKDISGLSAEEAKDLPTCLSLAKKPAKGPKKVKKLDGCLIGPRSAFKKYLTMGSDDHQIKPVFSPRSAPHVAPKKGAKAKTAGFTFRKEFLNGLQYAVEREVVTQLGEVWEALGKAKRLSHKAFVAAHMNYGEEPEVKEKKPKKKTAKKAEAGSPKKKKVAGKKAPAKKAGGKKKKAGRPKKAKASE